MHETLLFEDNIQVETQNWITEIINKSKLICKNCNSWDKFNDENFGYCKNKKLNENKIQDKDSLTFVSSFNISKTKFLIKTGKEFGCIHFNEKL